MQRQFPAAPTQGTTAAYLDQDQASEYLAEKGLKIAPKTFGKLRVIGGGPRYRKFGRKPLYAPLDLDEWVEKKLSEPLRSTSEANDRAIAATTAGWTVGAQRRPTDCG